MLLCFACNSLDTTNPPGSTPVANSSVIVVLTTTANDRLVGFNLAIASISLTDTAGNTITLYTNPNAESRTAGVVEFMTLNGASKPNPCRFCSSGPICQGRRRCRLL